MHTFCKNVSRSYLKPKKITNDDIKNLFLMASDFEKPDKVHTLFLSEVPTKMWRLPVRDLLFVGEETAKN